jgi:hypothetical protein
MNWVEEVKEHSVVAADWNTKNPAFRQGQLSSDGLGYLK